MDPTLWSRPRRRLPSGSSRRSWSAGRPTRHPGSTSRRVDLLTALFIATILIAAILLRGGLESGDHRQFWRILKFSTMYSKWPSSNCEIFTKKEFENKIYFTIFTHCFLSLKPRKLNQILLACLKILISVFWSCDRNYHFIPD